MTCLLRNKNKQLLILMLFFIGEVILGSSPVFALTQSDDIDFYNQKIKAAEVNGILYKLALKDKRISVKAVGYSENKQPIVKVSLVSLKKNDAESKVKVLIVAGQHGNEPSGTLAILSFLAGLGGDKYNKLLNHVDIDFIPLVNPDGWNKETRGNGKGININADYVLLKTPEARAVVSVINTESPNMLLDIHESSTYKSVLTGKQGYLTDVVSQLETSNNANVFKKIQDFANDHFLPAVMKEVFYQGSSAQRYQGAIMRLNQPLTGARSTINTLRNYASFHDVLSILLESKKDYQKRHFSTPENIKERVKRQKIALNSVLDQVVIDKANILALTCCKESINQKIIANVNYSLNKLKLSRNISLVNINTGLREIHSFPNWSDMTASQTYQRPVGYAITDNEGQLATWLSLHGIQVIQASKGEWSGINLRLKEREERKEAGIGARIEIIFHFDEEEKVLKLNPNNLIVPLNQPLGVLASLLLDPRSAYGLYQSQYENLTLNQVPSIVPLNAMKPFK
ncbi:M14 family zinc carboxypeptidase [uncultured Shewanella sp.]|uniref:M14 family zinc carboxypeptidase n=1 Tax=uncultured Shewanella sp. TaxID=173975 RepID=UPI00262765E3|nr:M14 family zinc carboxypeptidase [uncultured Shewanella sp.]